MSHTATKVVRWSSIPVLLTASLLARFAGSYELPVDLAIWLGAFFMAQQAVRAREYVLSAGFGVVVIVFSPLLLVDKIFLLMAYTSVLIFLTLAAAFRSRPLVAKLWTYTPLRLKSGQNSDPTFPSRPNPKQARTQIP